MSEHINLRAFIGNKPLDIGSAAELMAADDGDGLLYLDEYLLSCAASGSNALACETRFEALKSYNDHQCQAFMNALDYEQLDSASPQSAFFCQGIFFDLTIDKLLAHPNLDPIEYFPLVDQLFTSFEIFSQLARNPATSKKVKMEAIKRMVCLEPGSAKPFLWDKDIPTDVKIDLIDILKKQHANYITESGIDGAMMRLMNHDDPAVRRAALKAAQEIKCFNIDYMTMMIDAALKNDPDSDVRVEAVKAIEKLPSYERLERYMLALKDNDPSVRMEVLDHINDLCEYTEERFNIIKAALNDPGLQETAMQKLGLLRKADTADLLAIINKGDSRLRCEFIDHGLKHLPPYEYYPLLKDYLSDPDDNVRNAVVNVLHFNHNVINEMTFSQLAELMNTGLCDEDKTIRVRARMAVIYIQPDYLADAVTKMLRGMTCCTGKEDAIGWMQCLANDDQRDKIGGHSR